MTAVSLQDKRSFIEWFLAHHDLALREAVWILNYLLTDDPTLARIHFVEHSEVCPKGIFITTEEDVNLPFRYYTEDVLVVDAEKAFHDIRLHEEEIYVEVLFKDAMKSPHYVAVLEDNPFMPKAEVDYGMSKLAEELLQHNNKQHILSAIDEALDRGDAAAFHYWSEKLQQL